MTATTTRRAAVRLLALLAVCLMAVTLTAGTGSAQEEPPPPSTTTDPAPPQDTSTPNEAAPTTEPDPEPSAPASSAKPAPETSEPEQDTARAADDIVPLDDVDVAASLDKAAYNSGDLVTVTLKVTNNGAETIGPLTEHTCCELSIRDRGKLDELAVGIDLAPGEVFETTFTGYMDEIDGDEFHYDVAIVGPRNADSVSDVKTVHLSAAVTHTTGTYTGIVYADKNDNGKLDAGERLPRVKVNLSGGVPNDVHKRTTDAKGMFTIADIPTGPYQVWFTAPDGWYVTTPGGEFIVTEGDNPTATFKAVRPLSERLTPKLQFGKASYALDDQVDLQVTLTNTGPATLKGIKAFCNRVGNGNQLNADDDWGDLAPDAGGVTLAPGKSTTIDVVTDLPRGAQDYGYIVASCDFGQPELGVHGGPSDVTSANVAGIRGELEGKFVQAIGDPDKVGDKPIRGVRFSLVDPRSGKAVARGVSDADGEFEVSGIPANNYRMHLRDGWQFEWNNSSSIPVNVERHAPGRQYLELVGGPGGQPGGSPGGSDGGVSGGSGGGASGGSDDGLALTGFQVAQFGILGLLLIGTGAAAMAYARRRRNPVVDAEI